MSRRPGEFSIFRTISEFQTYVDQSTFNRRVTAIQNHHTFRPSYASFSNTTKNYLPVLNGMEQSHMNDRGWSQIGQNITTFPDGTIALCRPIDIMPAGIFGANKFGICLEHVGFFDFGADNMTEEHKEAIIHCNAILCRKFQLPVTIQHVVYHHWFDGNGRRFPDSFVNEGKVQAQKLQKSCPGTNFFGGNRVIDALNHFLPLVQAAVNQPAPPVQDGQPNAPVPNAVSKTVNGSLLNVRSGRGTTFSVLRQLRKDTVVHVYLTLDGWSKIDPIREEWVADIYLQ